jgi:hypothetical protein
MPATDKQRLAESLWKSGLLALLATLALYTLVFYRIYLKHSDVSEFWLLASLAGSLNLVATWCSILIILQLRARSRTPYEFIIWAIILVSLHFSAEITTRHLIPPITAMATGQSIQRLPDIAAAIATLFSLILAITALSVSIAYKISHRLGKSGPGPCTVEGCPRPHDLLPPPPSHLQEPNDAMDR